MIPNPLQRAEIAGQIAGAIDELVRDKLSGLFEEPDITSRLGQRLEDRLNGKSIAGHSVRVMTQTVPSHGQKSFEKPTGIDLYIAISVASADGHITKKGVLVQAKREDQLNHPGDWENLAKQCRRMDKITKKGSFVWIYTPNGVEVLRAPDVLHRREIPVASARDMFDDVLECHTGDKRQVPRGQFGDRRALEDYVRSVAAKNALWLKVEEQSRRQVRFRSRPNLLNVMRSW